MAKNAAEITPRSPTTDGSPRATRSVPGGRSGRAVTSTIAKPTAATAYAVGAVGPAREVDGDDAAGHGEREQQAAHRRDR